MKEFTGFSTGINLGGWLSQYSRFDHTHFKTFIDESDISRIASWGMDHVRLPVDYPLLEDDAEPFHYLESGFEYIDHCIEWCRKHQLNLILDIHRAPGYSFNALGESDLFSQPAQQQRFISLWETLARRYAGVRQPEVVFELLNEVVLADSRPWNDLALRLIETIRSIDPLHWIMVGGNKNNAISTLKEIPIFNDPNIVYTFHFYEPLPFTHQKAAWVPSLSRFDHNYDFPSPASGLGDFLKRYPEYRTDQNMESYIDCMMDKGDLEKRMQDAVDFIQKTGKPVYCGEFGVIDLAPMSGRINWNRDFIGLLIQNKIGRAYWSYKEMDFGIVDTNGRVVNEGLLKTICQQ